MKCFSYGILHLCLLLHALSQYYESCNRLRTDGIDRLQALLALLAELLVSEHSKMGLARVDDLPSLDYQQFSQPPYYSSTDHAASGYGGPPSVGPLWRGRGGRAGMNHSASWSSGGSFITYLTTEATLALVRHSDVPKNKRTNL